MNEKWFLIITDKDHEQVVERNIFIKPSVIRIEKNVKIFVFYDTKGEIDKLYGKLESIERKQELSLFVGDMLAKDMPGGLNEILDGLRTDED